MGTDETPRVWVGCLGCYNAGNLFGYWVDAVDAPDTTEEWLDECRRQGQHVAAPGIYDIHEELWCFDHEYLPISGECSPSEAKRIAEALDMVPDHIPAAAVRAYVENESGPTDWDALPDRIADAFMGEYDSVEDYVQDFYMDTVGSPEERELYDRMPFNCIDWGVVVRNFEGIWTAKSPDYKVFIFSDD